MSLNHDMESMNRIADKVVSGMAAQRRYNRALAEAQDNVINAAKNWAHSDSLVNREDLRKSIMDLQSLEA